MLYGAIEAGGTKFVCAVGTKDLEVIERIQIPTTTPIETMNNVIDFFKKHQDQLAAIGIGSFGPIDIHPNSATYGYITSTPKKAWQNVDFIGYLNKNLNIEKARVVLTFSYINKLICLLALRKNMKMLFSYESLK